MHRLWSALGLIQRSSRGGFEVGRDEYSQDCKGLPLLADRRMQVFSLLSIRPAKETLGKRSASSDWDPTKNKFGRELRVRTRRNLVHLCVIPIEWLEFQRRGDIAIDRSCHNFRPHRAQFSHCSFPEPRLSLSCPCKDRRSHW